MLGRFHRKVKTFLLTLPAVACILALFLFQNGVLNFHRMPSATSGFHFANVNQVMKARKLLDDDVFKILDILKVNLTKKENLSARHLPQSIIIGARKCGTRTLLKFLSLHSKIVTCGEEMHFFSNDSHYKNGLEWYRNKMPLTKPDQVTMEKTPKYLISLSAPARIHRMNSSIKLIVILRDPTTRVISDFTQIYTTKRFPNKSLPHFESIAIDPKTDAVNLEYKAIQISIYHQHIARWLQLFPRRQLLIVDGEEFIKDPQSQIVKVESFLGLNHQVTRDELYFNESRGFFCMRRSTKEKVERCMGLDKGRKHVNVSDRVVQKLVRFFRPHNEKLFKLIGQRFSWR